MLSGPGPGNRSITSTSASHQLHSLALQKIAPECLEGIPKFSRLSISRPELSIFHPNIGLSHHLDPTISFNRRISEEHPWLGPRQASSRSPPCTKSWKPLRTKRACLRPRPDARRVPQNMSVRLPNRPRNRVHTGQLRRRRLSRPISWEGFVEKAICSCKYLI